MSSLDLGVIALSVALIVWVNWYFFVAGRAPATAAIVAPSTPSPDAVAEVVIEVDGGYSPNTVRVKAGSPVRLVFDRKDDSSCSEEVVIPEFGVRTYLPTGQRTTIEITPKVAGRYGFTCGMSMLRGTIIAES